MTTLSGCRNAGTIAVPATARRELWAVPTDPADLAPLHDSTDRSQRGRWRVSHWCVPAEWVGDARRVGARWITETFLPTLAELAVRPVLDVPAHPEPVRLKRALDLLDGDLAAVRVQRPAAAAGTRVAAGLADAIELRAHASVGLVEELHPPRRTPAWHHVRDHLGDVMGEYREATGRAPDFVHLAVPDGASVRADQAAERATQVFLALRWLEDEGIETGTMLVDDHGRPTRGIVTVRRR